MVSDDGGMAFEDGDMEANGDSRIVELCIVNAGNVGGLV